MPRLDEAAFASFLDGDDGRPVVIFNLLRFGVETGADRLADAMANMRLQLEPWGAEILYIGDAPATLWEDQSGPWDAVAIVRYPSRRAFAEMVQHTEYYETANTLREASILEVVLRPLRVVN